MSHTPTKSNHVPQAQPGENFCPFGIHAYQDDQNAKLHFLRPPCDPHNCGLGIRPQNVCSFRLLAETAGDLSEMADAIAKIQHQAETS